MKKYILGESATEEPLEQIATWEREKEIGKSTMTSSNLRYVEFRA